MRARVKPPLGIAPILSPLVRDTEEFHKVGILYLPPKLVEVRIRDWRASPARLRSAPEPREDNLKRVEDFCFKAKAIIWP